MDEGHEHVPPVNTFRPPLSPPSTLAKYLRDVTFGPRLFTPKDYLPLLKPREIRVLRIHAVINPLDPLTRCSLVHVSLDDLDTQYEALSYQWTMFRASQFLDNHLRIYMIIVDGMRFRVQYNLWHALLQLRGSEERMLWVDAVCINQSDREERSSQVQLMRVIYTQASCVNVWLGRHHKWNRKMDTAMQLMDFAFENEDPKGWLNETLGKPQWLRHWKAMTALLGRTIWERTWIVQEITLAKELKLFCVGRNFEWNQLCLCARMWRSFSSQYWGVSGLTDQNYLWCRQVQAGETVFEKALGLGKAVWGFNRWADLPRLDWREASALIQSSRDFNVTSLEFNRKRMGDSMRPMLLELLVRNFPFMATDRRDKVYGLLGLVHCGEEFKVDYSLTEREVLVSVVKFLFEKYNRLDVLSYASYHRGLPSWVPFWGPGVEFRFIIPPSRVSWSSSQGFYARWDELPLLMPMGAGDKENSQWAHMTAPIEVNNLHSVLVDLSAQKSFSADRSERRTEATFENGSLIIRGIVVDRISAKLRIDDGKNQDDTGDITPRAGSLNGLSIPYFPAYSAQMWCLIKDTIEPALKYIVAKNLLSKHSDTEVLEILFRTLIGDRLNTFDAPDSSWGEVFQIISGFKRVEGFVEENVFQKMISYLSFAVWQLVDWTHGTRRVSWFQRRHLFVTEGGYIGRYESHARVGDSIVVVLGCDRPLVLHGIKEEGTAGAAGDALSGALKGSAYLHGWMEGKAVEEVDAGRLKIQTLVFR